MQPILSPDFPSGRRERERRERRRAMLEAALGVFSAKGFDGATVDEIAEVAEFGKGTLYNYFPGGKDELYLALVDETVADALRDVVDGAFGAPEWAATPASAREAFARFLGALLTRFGDQHGAVRLFVHGAHGAFADPERAVALGPAFERLIAMIEAPIATAMATGALRPLPPRGVAHLLLGNVHGYLMVAADPCGLGGPIVGPDAAADFLTTVLFDGLLAPPAPRP